MSKKTKYAMVTTAKRGVFFGKVPENAGVNDASLKIEECQMAVYFQDTRGVLGLCIDGPGQACRITKPIPSFEVNGLTGIADVSPKAVKAWKKCPWG